MPLFSLMGKMGGSRGTLESEGNPGEKKEEGEEKRESMGFLEEGFE